MNWFYKIKKKTGSIKNRMFILGVVIVSGFFILMVTAIFTNVRVRDAVRLTDSNININKILLNKLYELDIIQISQNKLVRHAKDVIISKDEEDIDKEKFLQIENEVTFLKKEIEGLYNFFTDKNNFYEPVKRREYISRIEKIKEIEEILSDYIKIRLRKNIEKRHEIIIAINDELLKLEFILNDMMQDINNYLYSFESDLREKLLLFKNDMVNYQKTYQQIECIINTKKVVCELILTAIAAIGFSDKGYIDDKRVVHVKENLTLLTKSINILKYSINGSEEMKKFLELENIIRKLTYVINNELASLFERIAKERGDIEFIFLKIDNDISSYADIGSRYISDLSVMIRDDVTKSGESLSFAQGALKYEIDNTLRLSLIVSFISIFIVIIFFIIFVNSIVSPLLLAVRLAKSIEGGDFSHRINIKREDEIGELAYALDDMADQLETFTRSLSLKNRELELEIEERKKAEEEIKRLNEELEERVKERTKELEKAHEELLIKERLALLGHFSGSISHEIRNPLGVIDSSIYFLNMKFEDVDDKIKKHFERIKRAVDKANSIIQSLLNLAKMRPPERVKCDLVEIFENVLGAISPPDSINIKRDFYKDKIEILVEREQIYMALKNILKNSLEALGEKGGTISICVRDEEDKIKMVISDTGDGIEESIKDKIFQPLFSTKTHGIGFGLSITKMIVENHGGNIEVVSKKGEGATFIITLPVFNSIV